MRNRKLTRKRYIGEKLERLIAANDITRPGVTDYLNGCPAFRTDAGTTGRAFYGARVAASARTRGPDYGDGLTGTVNRTIEKAGIGEEELDESIRPVIRVTRPGYAGKYRGKAAAETARAFSEFVEPFRRGFKGIRSTGHVDSLSRRASCPVGGEDDMSA